MNKCVVKTNECIANDVYKMKLSGDFSSIKKPGQFVNIKIPGFYLRRPISVCDWTMDELVIVYKILGHGTKVLAEYKEGQTLDILLPLGNGFDFKESKKYVLVGGGVGVPPMYGLAKKMVAAKCDVTVVLGFSSKQDVMLEKEFKDLGVNLKVATLDGTSGTKGNVLDILKDIKEFDSYFACGPKGMLLALAKWNEKGYLSFEERMACGFGACMGCSCKVVTGYKRICREGPVLEVKELVYE